MSQTSAERAALWLEAALTRAIQIERDAAERWHELTPAARTRRQRLPTSEPGAVETWYEPNPVRLPVEDPPNLVILKSPRYSAKWKRAVLPAESRAA